MKKANLKYSLVLPTRLSFTQRKLDIVNNEKKWFWRKKYNGLSYYCRRHVSGIADNCKKFAEFLTICRKYRYHCIYIFHIIAPESQILKKILSQTNIFNIFPLSVWYNTIAKILLSNCTQTATNNVPAQSV